MIPAIFDEILEQPFHRLLEEARDAGRRVLGYTCSYVPEALISVDGLQPVRARAPAVAGTPMADTYLSSVICSYARSLLESAMEGAQDGLDGWVFTSSCDHLRRLCDNLAYLTPATFLHILDLPHRLGDEALDWYVEELRILADALADRFHVDTGSAALGAAIHRHNEHLARLRAIGELRKRESPPITGTEFHKLLVACAVAPRDRLAGELERLARELGDREGEQAYRARLLVVGSHLDDPRYLRIIESVGGLVVADRFCVGSLPGLEPIPEDGDPLRSIAAHTLRKTSCPRMMEAFDQRVEAILEEARAFRADGVVLQTLKFCDTWGVESSPLVGALRDAGLPLLRLEREYALAGDGQLRTRVQAFLESMGK